MQEKVFTLINKGMNRDLSISKVGESCAFENHNIRILARDNDTLLSVTNERGNKLVESVNILGTVIGWNSLNKTIIVFSHDANETDRIYKIVYDGSNFTETLLFVGSLGLDCEFPIESITHYESDSIQKIYWVDGKNVLRFMNFAAEKDEQGHYPWQKADGSFDATYFDSNRKADFGVKVSISKDNSGTQRPNGVSQYILTYYNKHGQETAGIWISDLVYLSPFNTGGSADGSNNNRVTLRFNGLDTTFSNFKVYSVFKSTNNGSAAAYLVADKVTSQKEVIVIDDFAHNTTIDPQSLLFFGSRSVIAGTLANKDNTLFLGDLVSTGKKSYKSIEDALRKYMFGKWTSGYRFQQVPFVEDEIWESFRVKFVYSNDAGGGTENIPEAEDIKYVDNDANYPYVSQLDSTSSGILSFKGMEKYRFALKFKFRDGTETDAFWIGDKVNPLYPVMDINNNAIKRVVAKCEIPKVVFDEIEDRENLSAVQLLIADATDADRAVKAQGIVNPTMFNVWERYNNRLYSMPSWVSRPRGSSFANRHFEAVHKSTGSDGEIQCNYWKSLDPKNPYFQYKYADGEIPQEEIEGVLSFAQIMVVYNIWHLPADPFTYHCAFFIFRGSYSSTEGKEALNNFKFSDENFQTWLSYPDSAGSDKAVWLYKPDTVGYTIERTSGAVQGHFLFNKWEALLKTYESLRNKFADLGLLEHVVDRDTFTDWCQKIVDENGGGEFYFNRYLYDNVESRRGVGTKMLEVFDAEPLGQRWYTNDTEHTISSDSGMAYCKKQIMFVDENVLTLDSPELSYNATSVDNADLCFRIVGVAKMSSAMSDYSITATESQLNEQNLDIINFNGKRPQKRLIDGLTAWPLWKDSALDLISESASEGKDIEELTSSDYRISQRVVRYWIYLWQKSGNLFGYTDSDGTQYSPLDKKTVANLRFSYSTIYMSEGYRARLYYDTDFIREASFENDTYKLLNIAKSERRYYDGRPELYLGMPGTLKYPISYSNSVVDDTDNSVSADDAYLYTSSGVVLRYSTQRHAIIGLPTDTSVEDFYTQTILPAFFEDECVRIPNRDIVNKISGALLPWIGFRREGEEYAYRDYRVNQEHLNGFQANDSRCDTLTIGGDASDNYLFIGEIFDPINGDDMRYGGISLSAVASNRFIVAGPQYKLTDSVFASGIDIIGNQGDTYFQRWDALRVRPYSLDSENSVIDITSVMLETHINLDGRTDLQRGIAELASIDTEKFGSLNDVYSQKNTFSARRDLDEDFNVDSFRTSFTWTLPKADMAEVDEWTHITLASSLKLDGDKGICRAIRRFGNSLVAFQDRAISEILFNSRTQLTTTDGVPVEIANSGKVDGVRYISNKYGCVNKWSIVEGKNALYFVDNLNKALCAFAGSISNLSSSLNFSSWFRKNSVFAPWNPNNRNNIISFYDKVHSDVYLVAGNDTDQQCLVYNEQLNIFTSFFDYGSVDMMTNIDDRFLSMKDGRLWRQNEGFYGEFFGEQYPFWVQYRVAPGIAGDRVWTNLEFRSDFYRMLDENGDYLFGPSEDISDIGAADYIDKETFDSIRVWNEYQDTGSELGRMIKKFRTWRYEIPRSLIPGSNTRSLDRIRNPWINLTLKKIQNGEENRDLMQLHDVEVKYFE